ncbi:hypothetical protein [Arthrobacter pigmenti]
MSVQVDGLRRKQRVTAVVNSGRESREAGLQIRVDGQIRSGHRLAFANKKKALRFVVGEPGRHSSVWNAFANKTTSDVYVAIRSSASLHKMSLHESGDFRHQLIGMTKETLNRPDLAVDSLVADVSKGRVLHRWQRPVPLQAGWVSCMGILVPAGELRAGGGNFQDVEWVPEPAEGYGINIQCFLVTPGQGELELTGYVTDKGPLSVIGGFKLSNGEVFVVLSATVPFEAEDQKVIETARRQGLNNAAPDFDWAAEHGPRLLITTGGKADVPTFWDVDALASPQNTSE